MVAEANSAEKSDLSGQNFACAFLFAESKGQDFFGISQIIPEYYLQFTPALNQLTEGSPQSERYGVHRSPDRLQNNESSPPNPLSSRGPLRLAPTRGRSSSLGGTRFQSPPGLGDLGGKNLGDETQETYVYTVELERTNLVAPIFVHQKLWGFLAFHRWETAYQWEDFEMEICQPLADQIGIAVTQAQFICNMEELVDQQTKELRTSNQLLQQEIIKRRQMEQQLAHDALHDALTGLPNRALLTERIELTIQHAKRNRDYLFALLFIDLDRFKIINDSLGHGMGDRLLIAVAQFLQESLRDNDLVVRLGGDEFVILLDGIHGLQDATQIAARILERFASPFDI